MSLLSAAAALLSSASSASKHKATDSDKKKDFSFGKSSAGAHTAQILINDASNSIKKAPESRKASQRPSSTHAKPPSNDHLKGLGHDRHRNETNLDPGDHSGVQTPVPSFYNEMESGTVDLFVYSDLSSEEQYFQRGMSSLAELKRIYEIVLAETKTLSRLMIRNHNQHRRTFYWRAFKRVHANALKLTRLILETSTTKLFLTNEVLDKKGAKHQRYLRIVCECKALTTSSLYYCEKVATPHKGAGFAALGTVLVASSALYYHSMCQALEHIQQAYEEVEKLQGERQKSKRQVSDAVVEKWFIDDRATASKSSPPVPISQSANETSVLACSESNTPNFAKLQVNSPSPTSEMPMVAKMKNSNESKTALDSVSAPVQNADAKKKGGEEVKNKKKRALDAMLGIYDISGSNTKKIKNGNSSLEKEALREKKSTAKPGSSLGSMQFFK